MLVKTKLKSFSEGIRGMVLIALLAATFLAVPVLAEGEGPTVSVERLKGIGVGMKIVFSDAISGDLSVFINGVKMNCEAVASNTLYCVGPLRPNEFGNLTITDGTGNTTIFATTVVGPASNNQKGEDCIPRPVELSPPKGGSPPRPQPNWCGPAFN
jgi:hypothetical protein